MDRLNCFAGYAKNIKTPKDLYEAIHKFGPLPRYHTVGVNAKQEDDIHLKEPAVEDANAIYEFVRRIATNLRKSKPELLPLPPTETDPFLGLQTIQEWCIDAEKTTKPADLANLKPAEKEENAAPAKGWKMRTWIWVKSIPRWIYVLVIFLASLLTCIYFLWWLWTTFWKK